MFPRPRSTIGVGADEIVATVITSASSVCLLIEAHTVLTPVAVVIELVLLMSTEPFPMVFPVAAHTDTVIAYAVFRARHSNDSCRQVPSTTFPAIGKLCRNHHKS